MNHHVCVRPASLQSGRIGEVFTNGDCGRKIGRLTVDVLVAICDLLEIEGPHSFQVDVPSCIVELCDVGVTLSVAEDKNAAGRQWIQDDQRAFAESSRA